MNNIQTDINYKKYADLFLSTIKLGVEIFGTYKEFEKWLKSKNFFFWDKTPKSFLKDMKGLEFVNSRLVAMQYGDNV